MPGSKISCPHCNSLFRQTKWGKTPAGSQKYRCNNCCRVYTAEPKQSGYPMETRIKAMQLYQTGHNCRQIGRLLNVHHQTVVNWLTQPVPASLEQAVVGVIDSRWQNERRDLPAKPVVGIH